MLSATAARTHRKISDTGTRHDPLLGHLIVAAPQARLARRGDRLRWPRRQVANVGDGDVARTEAYGGVAASWTTYQWQPEQLVALVEQAGLRPVAELRLRADGGPTFCDSHLAGILGLLIGRSTFLCHKLILSIQEWLASQS
jgi:hypothetical protein